MQHALAQPDSTPPALWLPPARMKHYAIARIIGGVLFAMIFAGWMALQWSSITMRVIASGLILLTAYVTAASIAADARRMRGRQVQWCHDELRITTPDGSTPVRLSQIMHAKWSDEPDDFGLSFYDRNENRLARLDENILADEAEARVFLRWLRTHEETKFEVKWK